MVINRQTFNYEGQKLIVRVTIKAPYRLDALFENSGCFLYFKDAGFKLQSASRKDQEIASQEAVLMRCGAHFFDLLNTIDSDTVEVIAIHMFPELLKKLYAHELPTLLAKAERTKDDSIVVPQNLITKFISSLEFYFDNPSLVTDDLLELKIKELILLLIQTKNVDSILELLNDLYSPRAIQLKSVIELHQYSNLSIEELAQLCNLSLSSFKREFKKIFNDSPQNYINTKKIDKAKKLLTNTKMPINEIAYTAGFNDPQYFTRSFKKHVGISPSNFRG